MIIKIPENCSQERSYVLHVIFKTLLGLDYQLVIEKELNDTIILIDHHAYVLVDDFFGTETNPQILYSNRMLDLKAKHGSGLLDGLIFLFGTDRVENEAQSTKIYADIFATAFFMLSRWEELNGRPDNHGRFRGVDSIAYQNGFHLRPVVNEYAAFFKRMVTNARVEVPETHVFRKIFTCDVDMPFYWMRKPLRKLIGSFFRQRKGAPGFMQKWKSFLAYKRNALSDPYYTFDQIMADAEENGIELVFYFMSGGESKYDRYYSINDKRIKKLLYKIQKKGHQIGLHGSYHSFQDENVLSHEKRVLEEVAEEEIVSGRQHFLRFSIYRSILTFQKVNIKTDSTLGYADLPGFRNGICHRFPLFDLNERKMTDVVESPLLIMDATLRHYLNLKSEDAIKIINQLATEVRKHKGEFVYLWHNSSFEFGGYEDYRPVYNSLLSC